MKRFISFFIFVLFLGVVLTPSLYAKKDPFNGFFGVKMGISATEFVKTFKYKDQLYFKGGLFTLIDFVLGKAKIQVIGFSLNLIFPYFHNLQS